MTAAKKKEFKDNKKDKLEKFKITRKCVVLSLIGKVHHLVSQIIEILREELKKKT